MNSHDKLRASILVVDDKQSAQESIRKILEGAGYRITQAYKVDQALEKLKQETFDLVFADLMQAERRGMDLVDAVAQNYPRTGIVAFTEIPDVDSAVESIKLGALDYLSKPFATDELLLVTNRAIEKVTDRRRDLEIEKFFADAENDLRSSLDLDEVLTMICSNVVSLFHAAGSAIFVFRERDRVFELVSSCGLSRSYTKKGIVDAAKSISEMLSTGKPVTVEAPNFDTTLQYPDEARRENIASILSIPLKTGDTVCGALRIYSSEQRNFNKELDLLLKFADLAAGALKNALTYGAVRTDIETLRNYFPASEQRQT